MQGIANRKGGVMRLIVNVSETVQGLTGIGLEYLVETDASGVQWVRAKFLDGMLVCAESEGKGGTHGDSEETKAA